MYSESFHEGYLISDDPRKLDITVIHGYLSRSYWAENVSREIVERSVENSLCIGIYASTGEQIGFVRLITDYSTFAWICDVFVLENHRGRGLSKAAIQAALAHPRLQSLRRFALATRDAHGLYERFGFTPLAHPENHLERRRPSPPTAASSVSPTPGKR
jgi:GNAT superfamily N-acetyltransferase